MSVLQARTNGGMHTGGVVGRPITARTSPFRRVEGAPAGGPARANVQAHTTTTTGLSTTRPTITVFYHALDHAAISCTNTSTKYAEAKEPTGVD